MTQFIATKYVITPRVHKKIQYMVTTGLIRNIFNPALITVRRGIKPDKNRDFVVLS